ncbi:MAG: response regulator transcription factor [Halorhodospira sp.]
MKASLLIVEDDPAIRALCRELLVSRGYTVAEAGSLEEAWRRLESSDFAGAVVDLSLPDGDGMEVVTRIGGELPVVIMTVRDTPTDRVSGFEHGAADYIIKPFHAEELGYRMDRLLGPPDSPQPPTRWWLDPATFCVRDTAGGALRLTQGETALLQTLCAAKGEAVTRDVLLDALPGARCDNPKTVDVLVYRLRRKLEPEPPRPEHLLTVPGVGYRLQGVRCR